MLVGPQQGAVAIIDQAVAVRPNDRHVACNFHQFGLQPRSVRIIRAGLEKAGSEADRPARAALAQLADDLNREIAVDADEGRVRRAG